MTKIIIDASYCKGCDICLGVCKKELFQKSKKRNNYGTPLPHVPHPEECIKCRLCERLCPDGAIDVIIEDAEANGGTHET